MALKKRSKFYLGLMIITIAIIFLAFVLYYGLHTQIPESRPDLIYDHPNGPVFEDIKPGNRLELSFESDRPINVILLRTKFASKYFNLEDRTVEHTLLFADSTGGYIEHTFDKSGTWGVYFENPSPPPKPKPQVRYWGQLIKQDDDYLYYYMKLTLGVIVLVLGSALLISSREKRASDKKKEKAKKRAK